MSTKQEHAASVAPASGKKRLRSYFTAKNITMLATFSALSVFLYYLPKIIPIFSLPIFPGFLELQISDLPALLAGYTMGPVAGTIVIVVRTLLKLPMTSTACVGELADLIIGLAFVLPAALFYKKFRTLRGALLSLILGVVSTVAAAVFCNWAFLVRFYAGFFPFGMPGIIGMVQTPIRLFNPEFVLTEAAFYRYYLLYAILPFNLLRSLICAILTFFVYKAVGRLFERLYTRGRKSAPKAPTPPEQEDDADSAINREKETDC